MLRQCERVVEPRQIGDIEHQRRRRPWCVPRIDDLCAEQILVADVDGDLLARQRERLCSRTALLVADGHLHQIHKPSKARRNEFAERHQMAFAVTAHAGIARCIPHGAVEVLTTRLFEENTVDHRRLMLLRKVTKRL